MDARITRTALLAVVLLASLGAGYRTPNFIIHNPDPQFAAQLGQAAERYRRELAISWLGEAMPDWSRPCPITVQDGPHLGAGGATTFVFDQGEVFGWRMTIQGSRQRLLDSVLPHEITHMIFASHFRRPLPRWADEGGASTVEHCAETNKHKRMLIQFLQTGRGIAFNRMFAMKEYPQDIMPLYAQGYSLAELLIQRGGRRRYIEFLDDGMREGNWSAAVKKHYGIEDLGQLQTVWLSWVRQGYPQQKPMVEPEQAAPALQIAASGKRPRPVPNLIHRDAAQDLAATAGRAAAPIVASPDPYLPGSIDRRPARQAEGVALASADDHSYGGWHAAGQQPGRAEPVAVAAAPASPNPEVSEVTRPQLPEKSRQIILQWGRGNPRALRPLPPY